VKSLSKIVLAAACLSIAVLAAPYSVALAQDAEAVIKARQAHMRLTSFNLGPLGAMAKGEMPYDAAVAAAAAGNLAAIAALDQSRIWAPGTGRPDAENTRALAAIWENPDDFASKIEGLRTATATMAEAAGTGLDALRAAMGGVGKACSACHETYRAEK
jgi:cytochrome c556